MSLFLTSEELRRATVYVVVARDLRTREWARTKVGFSTDPGGRCATIAAHERRAGNVGQFYEMPHYLQHPSAWAIEKTLHRFLAEFSLGREWFSCSPDYAWEHLQRIARGLE